MLLNAVCGERLSNSHTGEFGMPPDRADRAYITSNFPLSFLNLFSFSDPDYRHLSAPVWLVD